MTYYEKKGRRVFERKLVVFGSGSFPIDMLRYDNCIPVDEPEAHKIEQSQCNRCNTLPINHVWTVELKKICLDKSSQPNVERWNSFGWVVVEFDDQEYCWSNRGDDGKHDKILRLYHEYLHKKDEEHQRNEREIEERRNRS